MCETHRQRRRRHGDPEQESIQKRDIKPYIEHVQKLVERDTSGKIKAGLNQIKGILEEYARGVLNDFHKGNITNRHRVQVAHDLTKVFQDADAVQCACTVAAMYLLWEHNPRSFASASGFRFQLARRFRALSDTNVGSYYSHKTDKVHRVYRDSPAKANEELGRLLMEGYKTFVALVIRHEREETKRSKEAKELLEEGFAGISSRKEST